MVQAISWLQEIADCAYLDLTVLLQVVMETPGSSYTTASNNFNSQLTSLEVVRNFESMDTSLDT